MIFRRRNTDSDAADTRDDATEAAGSATSRDTGSRPKPEPSRPSAETSEAEAKGKGRPTPTRKSAEARNVRPLVADRKSAKIERRKQRNIAWARQQEAMRTGDERYLPPRDKGPVRRKVRDWIDSRWMPSNWFIPTAILIMVLMITVGGIAPDIAFILTVSMYVLLFLCLAWSLIMIRSMMRGITEEFGEEKIPRGTRFYALGRSFYFRRMRNPKPQVNLGGTPIERAPR